MASGVTLPCSDIFNKQRKAKATNTKPTQKRKTTTKTREKTTKQGLGPWEKANITKGDFKD